MKRVALGVLVVGTAIFLGAFLIPVSNRAPILWQVGWAVLGSAWGLIPLRHAVRRFPNVGVVQLLVAGPLLAVAGAWFLANRTEDPLASLSLVNGWVLAFVLIVWGSKRERADR